MPNRLQKRWVFTWNADSVGYLPSPPDVKRFLDQECVEAVFQMEAGEETGRRHYQGRFNLKGSRTSKLKLLQLFSKLGSIEHLTLAPELAYDSSSYCEKSETRVSGPWYAGLESYKMEKRPMRLCLKRWQEQLLSLLTGKHQDYLRGRKVIWVQDSTGGHGKSTFIRYLAMNSANLGLEMEKFPIDRPDRVRSAVVKLAKKKDVDLYMFDFTRTQGEDTSFNDLFEVIEEIKNSYVVDIMYGNFNRAFLKPAIVMIFTNNDIKDFEAYLSQDRWEPFVIAPEDGVEGSHQLAYLDLSSRSTQGAPFRIPFEQYSQDKLKNYSNDLINDNIDF